MAINGGLSAWWFHLAAVVTTHEFTNSRDDVYKLPKLRRDPRAGARTICTTACVADIGAAMTEAVEQPVDSVLDILSAPVREAAATVTASSPSSFAWVPAMCRRFALA